MEPRCLCPGRAPRPGVPAAIYIFPDRGAARKLGERCGERPSEIVPAVNELCAGEEYPAPIIFAF